MAKIADVKIIDTTKQIADLVDWLALLHEEGMYLPAFYIDLEGVDLCREGKISILTLHIDIGCPTTWVTVIDVWALGPLAFNTTDNKAKCLKDVLQDPKISRVFFDVRNDSDALFALYGVAMQGVEDVQLMESATRKTTDSRRYLSGLRKCIADSCLHLLDIDLTSWMQTKTEGERLFKAERGGSYEVFNRRPMDMAIVKYCAGDMQCLPGLYKKFRDGSTRWQTLIKEASQQRVADSQKPDYQPHGQHRALAPWSAEQNKLLDEWNGLVYSSAGGSSDDDAAFNEDLMLRCLNGGDSDDHGFWDDDDGYGGPH